MNTASKTRYCLEMNAMPKYTGISPLVARRLPRYYRHLTELIDMGIKRISSHEFSKVTGFTASQIRQDLNCFGGFGQQGYGYNVSSLRDEIGHILAVDKELPAIMIGAGNLGHAIINHISFEQCGFKLAGIFETNPAVVGQNINGLMVRDCSEMKDFCKEYKPAAAVLCIPPAFVPDIAAALVEHGVKSFWNFSQYDLSHLYPDRIVVEDVHLRDSLMTLSYRANALTAD